MRGSGKRCHRPLPPPWSLRKAYGTFMFSFHANRFYKGRCAFLHLPRLPGRSTATSPYTCLCCGVVRSGAGQRGRRLPFSTRCRSVAATQPGTNDGGALGARRAGFTSLRTEDVRRSPAGDAFDSRFTDGAAPCQAVGELAFGAAPQAVSSQTGQRWKSGKSYRPERYDGRNCWTAC